MKLIKLWDKIGKQSLKDMQRTDVIVQYGDDILYVNGIIYEGGKFVSLQAVKVNCKTCENCDNANKCDLCESGDLWEIKR